VLFFDFCVNPSTAESFPYITIDYYRSISITFTRIFPLSFILEQNNP
jgi:hypothetical protein